MIYPSQKTAGIVTLNQYTMMPDTEQYMYVWCAEWMVVIDKEVPIDGFRSTEHWQLIGTVDGEAVIVIPGCQVKGWVKVDTKPVARQTLYLAG